MTFSVGTRAYAETDATIRGTIDAVADEGGHGVRQLYRINDHWMPAEVLVAM